MIMSNPKIRFSAFTDDWEQCKFEDYYKMASGYAFKYQDYCEDGVPLINGESIQHGKIDNSNLNNLPVSFINEYSDFVLHEKDIVVGLNRPITNGNLKIARIPSDYEGSLLYQRAGRIQYKNDIDMDFSYILLSQEILKFTLREAVGSDQPFISTSKLDKWKINIPSDKNEQVKIGSFFINLDNLITLHQRKCDDLKIFKKSMLQKMFPKNGERFPEVRFAGFTDDCNWEQRKLSEITTEKLSNGIMNHPSEENTDVKHINVINMYTADKIHIEDLTDSEYDDEAIKKCNVEIGDIFLTRSSVKPEGIAEANVLLDSGRFVFDDHLIRMKIDKNKYDALFVKICLGSPLIKRQFIMKSKTTAFTTIGQDDIASCDGIFPLLAEQRKISEFFSNLDNLITLHQRKYDNLKELKKYMLQNMFPTKG